MTWTEPKPPTKGKSSYDHTTCETPLGIIIIESKSWKERPSYDVMLDNTWIGCEYSLEEAKIRAHWYLVETLEDLNRFLNPPQK